MDRIVNKSTITDARVVMGVSDLVEKVGKNLE
jgi:hypothetical protein